MRYGCIKAIADCWLGEQPALRMLITIDHGDWIYLYIGATNYTFCEDDAVSWDEHNLYWYMQDHNVTFNLMSAAMTMS